MLGILKLTATKYWHKNWDDDNRDKLRFVLMLSVLLSQGFTLQWKMKIFI